MKKHSYTGHNISFFMSKNTVLVVFGGSSLEHKVSLDSAQTIIQWLDRDKYDILTLGISKTGECFLWPQAMDMLLSESQDYSGTEDIFLIGHRANTCGHFIQCLNSLIKQPDIIFPIIHGFTGEDGRLQGVLDLLWIPYVGSGVSGSAICMDKIFTKAILGKNGISQLPYYWFTDFDWQEKREAVLREIRSLGFPLFIKPANLGSSIGISKVVSIDTLITSIEEALKYDKRILAEQWLDRPREIELAVIGHDQFMISCAGEVLLDKKYEFYTYEAKYIDTAWTRTDIPADISPELYMILRDFAEESCHALNIRGLCRVDFFVDQATGKYYLNELNTMPELTLDSMFASLWRASGLEYPLLLDHLIEFAQKK